MTNLTQAVLDTISCEWAEYKTDINWQILCLKDEVRKLRLKLNLLDQEYNKHVSESPTNKPINLSINNVISRSVGP